MDFSLIWLLTGGLLGFIFGYGICAKLVSNNISDLESEVSDLRIQRQLLKEEIFRLSVPKAKPTPRKKRKRKTRKSR